MCRTCLFLTPTFPPRSTRHPAHPVGALKRSATPRVSRPMRIISRTELAEFHDAYSYDQVTPIAWLYRQLLSLHDLVQHGTPLRLDDDTSTVLHTSDEFSAWVRDTYPGFRDDPLHPCFSER